MTNKERNLIKAKIIKCLTEDFKNNFLHTYQEMKDVLGSAAVASSYLIPGAGVGANLATKVGAGIGAGYLADVGMGLQEGKENPFTPGFGTIVGATIPVFGTLLGKATRTIPKWLIRGQLKKLPTEVSKKYKPNAAGGFTRQQQTDMADEVLKMKSWTKKGLVAESQGVAKNMETEIDTILNSPKYKSATGNSKGVFSYVKEKFGNSEFVDSDKKIIKIIKNIAKDESTLVDKVYNGTATIAEQNTLRKAIDRGINYPSVDADSAFNKRIGKEFVNYIRGNVQTTATETVPLFDEYSKSLQILKAAKNVRNSGDISIFDIMAFIHGGIGGVALERAARLPNARIGAAKVINKLRSSKIVPLVSGVATKEAASQNSDQKSEQ